MHPHQDIMSFQQYDVHEDTIILVQIYAMHVICANPSPFPFNANRHSSPT